MSRKTLTWQSVAEMVRRATSRLGRQQGGFYTVEGTRLVERALRSGAELEIALADEHFACDSDLVHFLVAANCQVVIAPDPVMATLTSGRDSGGVIGLVRLPQPAEPASLLGNTPALAVAAIDIVDPGNVGALMRTAHAAGASGFLVTGASDPFHPRATRISRGSVFKLPVAYFPELSNLTTTLRHAGAGIVAAVAEGGTALPDVRWPRHDLILLMGNEATGLSAEAVAASDYAVTIPMVEGVDSYAVNAAAAIIAYDIRRQQTEAP